MRGMAVVFAALLAAGLAGCTSSSAGRGGGAACDPSAVDADRQVVQAFLVAYNARDLERLAELAPVDEIWDPAGIPHLGQAGWTDLGAWAEAGWEVADRLSLVEFTSYGPSEGSDIVVRRTNRVLAGAGVESFDFSFKVPSDGCSIERLVGGIGSFGDLTGRCEFYQAFGEEVLVGVLGLAVPVECS